MSTETKCKQQAPFINLAKILTLFGRHLCRGFVLVQRGGITRYERERRVKEERKLKRPVKQNQIQNQLLCFDLRRDTRNVTTPSLMSVRLCKSKLVPPFALLLFIYLFIYLVSQLVSWLVSQLFLYLVIYLYIYLSKRK